MKAIITLPIVVLLSGCLATVPVKPKFPEPVTELMKVCPELKEITTGTTKLSETITVVTSNYAEYHLCRSKVDSWIEWYNEQKKIYDEVK
jgi:hypothetical protein